MNGECYGWRSSIQERPKDVIQLTHSLQILKSGILLITGKNNTVCYINTIIVPNVNSIRERMELAPIVY